MAVTFAIVHKTEAIIDKMIIMHHRRVICGSLKTEHTRSRALIDKRFSFCHRFAIKIVKSGCGARAHGCPAANGTWRRKLPLGCENFLCPCSNSPNLSN